MQKIKKLLHIQHIFLLIINFLFTVSIAENLPSNFCGKFGIKPAFFNPNSPSSSPLSNLILCKSQKPYLRTSLGVFPISSINYTTKTLTVSHPFPSSSTKNYISPSIFSSGFPSPSPNYTNSLLLFNCSKKPQPTSDFLRNCTGLQLLEATDSEIQETKVTYHHFDHSSCLFVEDVEMVGDMEFHPKDLNCSHYRRVHRRRSLSDSDDSNKELEIGTKVTFDIPTPHVPDICKKCEQPYGDCGVTLRCVCHPKECKNRVVNMGGNLNPAGIILYSFLIHTVLMVLWRN